MHTYMYVCMYGSSCNNLNTMRIKYGSMCVCTLEEEVCGLANGSSTGFLQLPWHNVLHDSILCMHVC